MSVFLKIDTAGNILSAGFCDFTPELQAGQTQVDSGLPHMPKDITTAFVWDIANKQLTAAPTPPPPTAALTRQLAIQARGYTPATAALFLVSIKGAAAPQWARDLIAAEVSVLQNL